MHINNRPIQVRLSRLQLFRQPSHLRIAQAKIRPTAAGRNKIENEAPAPAILGRVGKIFGAENLIKIRERTVFEIVIAGKNVQGNRSREAVSAILRYCSGVA
jgi:hypothetical protein